jgi:hypothetical protein
MSKMEILLERIARGVERLAEDPVVEIESGPPICPHCNVFNPDVHVNADEGRGPLYEFFVIAECQNCQNTIYVLPIQWSIFASNKELEAALADRISEIEKGGENGGS